MDLITEGRVVDWEWVGNKFTCHNPSCGGPPAWGINLCTLDMDSPNRIPTPGQMGMRTFDWIEQNDSFGVFSSK